MRSIVGLRAKKILAKPAALVVVVVVILFSVVKWYSGDRPYLQLWPERTPVSGVVWQPDSDTTKLDGNWEELGVDTLLVQWLEVDGIGFAPGVGVPPPHLPNWNSISTQPWAKKVILGLAGSFSEQKSRDQTVELAERSSAIAHTQLPLNIAGYYFPVEVDPTWDEAPEVMKRALKLLPRPIWISVYDGENIGGEALATWLAGWLPDDVGILFQDGVGVETRSPPVARQYADALAKQFGKERVRVIVEAFRPGLDTLFRPASADELTPQIQAMRGFEIYLFDGPHYLNDRAVLSVKEKL